MKILIGTSISGLILPRALILMLMSAFAVLPQAHAVSPPPDGGYPGFNTAEGQKALFNLTSGVGNTAVGWYSLSSNLTASYNTGLGAGALALNAADSNTAIGAAALLLNISGSNNTAVGVAALANSNADDNTATGAFALQNNTMGINNTAVGVNALFMNTTGLNNMGLGFQAGSSVSTASHVICIGASGQNIDNSCYIGQIFGATTSAGSPVFIDSNNKLGTSTSSKRYKEDIKPMDKASEALFALKPVSFHYKKKIDPAGTSQLGLVAEDVEKVNPDLVVHDKEGKPYSVRYEQVNAMLLNEFLKEHRRVQELRTFDADQKKQIRSQENQIAQLTSTVEKQETLLAQQQKMLSHLVARLETAESKIQKVNAQIDASKFAAQVVASRP